MSMFEKNWNLDIHPAKEWQNRFMQVKLSKQNPYAPAYLKADVSEKNGGKKKKKTSG